MHKILPKLVTQTLNSFAAQADFVQSNLVSDIHKLRAISNRATWASWLR